MFSKYLPHRASEVLDIAQFAAVSGIFGYAMVQLFLYGLFSRGYLYIHWLYIAMFLVVVLAYFAYDMTNVLYVIPIGVVYYCLHEALFNLFFLSYYRFQNPPGAATEWYEEMAVIAIVTPIFVALCIKYRNRLLRSGVLGKLSICLWGGLIVLFIVRMAYGFPVSVNVYDISGNYTLAMANEFEFVTNVLFAITFFSTFSFGRKVKKKPPELPKESEVQLTGEIQEPRT